ncbi:MAG: response regulator transcription factor [Bellilinea sp.]
MQTKAKILLVEGKRSDRASFQGGLSNKLFMVNSVSSGSAGVAQMAEFEPDIIIVDAASLRSSGKRICSTLHAEAPKIPMILIIESSANAGIESCANVILHMPFTLQKLLNRLKPFLPQDPKNGTSIGPITLDKDTHSVRCLDRQASLTPRLAALLEMLMDHAGKVIPRETLFSKVWETEYTGDTRTLDVHISWLRQAIEDDPRHPRFIKTLRGVGYRLDVEK